MTDNHPITPPPELIEKWHSTSPLDRSVTVATQAARWGADQELEACWVWLYNSDFRELAKELNSHRRPKPLSLAEESLDLLDKIQGNKKMWQIEELDVVRRALERLQELEGGND